MENEVESNKHSKFIVKYHKFSIEKYKAIKDSVVSVLNEPIPLIGVNESGKSSALEAIARFDYRNDAIAEQKKWRFINRYIPSESVFSIVAEIFIELPDDIEKIIEHYSDQEKEELKGLLVPVIKDKQFFCKRILRKSESGLSFLYSIGDKESVLIEKFGHDLVGQLPRIFYFDNFLEDQFPDKIDFPVEYFSNQDFILNEYPSIIEGMFVEAGYSLKSFLDEIDDNTKNTQIAEVNRVTTNKLISEWTAMQIGKTELDVDSMNNLQINLQQDRVDAHSVNINILEKFIDESGISRTTSMLLSERSLGFRWFFNFSAKKAYGARGERKFIYLFDEPGSYLHNSAQTILLKAIRDLAKDHPVIFSTHSEFLLDPEIININNVRILEKNDRQITLIPLSEISEKKTMGALSTLYNALRMKISVNSTLNQKVIVTEGITDFYFWKMLTRDLVILPGFGAGQNEYLISIAIGTSKKYVAFFDGDVAGEQAIQKYIRFFHEQEKEHWKKYIDKDSNEIELEQILSGQDRQRLIDATGMKDLKKAITSMYFCSDSDREKYWGHIDDETKNNLKANIKNLKTLLNLTSIAHFNYQLGK